VLRKLKALGLHPMRSSRTQHTLKTAQPACCRAGRLRAVAAGAAVQAAPQRPGQRLCSAAAGAGAPGVASQHGGRRGCDGVRPSSAAARRAAPEQCRGSGRAGASYDPGQQEAYNTHALPYMSSCFVPELPTIVRCALQALMQHLAGDDFWQSADAVAARLHSPHEVGLCHRCFDMCCQTTAGVPQCASPKHCSPENGQQVLTRSVTAQAALRVGSWMADAGAGPADITAASAFLRRLSEPQRLAVVGRAHAVVTAVLQRAAPAIKLRTPQGTPQRLSLDPAGLPDVQPTLGQVQQQQQQVQQQQQQAMQVPSLRPRNSGGLTACASDPDLYAAFTEAVAAAGDAAAPEPASVAADAAAAVSAASEPEAGLSATPPAEVPGPRVLVTDPGCTACQDKTALSSSSSSSVSSRMADSFAKAPARADSSQLATHVVAKAAPLQRTILPPPRRTSSDAAARLYSSFAEGDSHLAAAVMDDRDVSFWQAAAEAGAAASPASSLPAVAEQDSLTLAEQMPAEAFATSSEAAASPELTLEPGSLSMPAGRTSCKAETGPSSSSSEAAETRHSTSSDLNNSAGSLAGGAESLLLKRVASQGQPRSPFASPSAKSPFAAAGEAAAEAPLAMPPARPPVKPPLMAKNRRGSLQREVSGDLQPAA
jgi:hypothetical protein